MKQDDDNVPRWQQGLRPFTYGEVWDAMTPRERRRAFIGDIVVAIVGAAAIFLAFGGLG